MIPDFDGWAGFWLVSRLEIPANTMTWKVWVSQLALLCLVDIFGWRYPRPMPCSHHVRTYQDHPQQPALLGQLVEGVRDGGKVRHIGVAMDEDELERLRQLGEYVKAKLEDEHQPSLFAPETIADRAIRVGRQGGGRQELPVDLKQLEEEQRLITGIHEVCGEMCRRLEEDFGVSLPLE